MATAATCARIRGSVEQICKRPRHPVLPSVGQQRWSGRWHRRSSLASMGQQRRVASGHGTPCCRPWGSRGGADGGTGDPLWHPWGSRGEWQAATSACARVLGAVKERAAVIESIVRVHWVAEEEGTAATSISARAHGATASRGGVGGGDPRWRPCGSKGGRQIVIMRAEKITGLKSPIPAN